MNRLRCAMGTSEENRAKEILLLRGCECGRLLSFDSGPVFLYAANNPIPIDVLCHRCAEAIKL